MFKVVDGIVNIVKSPFQSETNTKVYDEALTIPDQKKDFLSRTMSFPTTGLVYE